MNTEATQDNTAPAMPGERLRQARERMGLSQQMVAERLCLKITTIKEIEDDNTPTDLASTFLRGYIRSYAKLVHLPESELQPILDRHAVPRVSNVAPMQSFSLGKIRKKRDGWLMTFTWLVLLVVLGLTGAWWWQNYQAQQQEIHSMVDHAAAQESEAEQPVPLAPPPSVAQQGADVTPSAPSSAPGADTAPSPYASAAEPVSPQAPLANDGATADHSPAPNAAAAPSAPAEGVPPVPAPADAIVMTFTADCWLEVVDASGKKLFSGMQRNGGALNLNGQAPYHVKIGAPAAVQIQYQGKPVDLSRFVRSNQVARLTLAAE